MLKCNKKFHCRSKKQNCRLASIALALFIAINLLTYSTIINNENTNEEFWRWPTYDTWTIDKALPKYDDVIPYDVSMHRQTEKNKEREVQFAKDHTESSKTYFKNDEKIIVFSHPPFKEKFPHFVDESECGVKCQVTYDRSLLPIADAVIFHFTDDKPMPPRSFQNQLYVWMNQESPSSTWTSRRLNFKHNNVFNLTMTYRRDSDIYFPYFTLLEVRKAIERDPTLKNIDSLVASKDRHSLWVTGNCGYTKGSGTRTRMMLQFVNEGLDVDIYGPCVNRRLRGTWEDMPKYVTKYKFYFAFENALHCRDYITEKTWWNALRGGAVPVIWGPAKSDVKAVLPDGSYIFVEDFDSPKDLVNYLNFLNKKRSAYTRYFNWRKENIKKKVFAKENENMLWTNHKMTGFCQLCRLLHDDEKHEREHGTRPKRVIESIHDWWYLEETRTCLNPRSFCEGVLAYLYTILCNLHIYFNFICYIRYYTWFCGILIILIVLDIYGHIFQKKLGEKKIKR